MKKNGHAIDLVAFVQNRKDLKNTGHLKKYCGAIYTVWNPRWWSALKMLLGIFSLTPFQVLYYTSVRMHLLLKKLDKKNSYDGIHFVLAGMMEFNSCFKERSLIVDHITPLSRKTKVQVSHSKNIFVKGLYYWEYYKTLLYERKIRNLHSYSLVSKTDHLTDLEYNRVKVISNEKKYLYSELNDAYRRADRLNIAYREEKSEGKIPLSIYHNEQVEPLDKEIGHFLDDFLRRSFDIFAAALGLIIASPVCLIVALLIFLQDGNPVFFKQYRVGKNNRLFAIIKFRTMVKNAEKKSGAIFAQKGDVRITPLGRFLRLSRLDEIPQLFNVLRGNMSLIGPRPERPEFTKGFTIEIPFYDNRLKVKPGLTGWAQVSFPYACSTDDTRKKLEYDLFYIKNRSAKLALAILGKTITVVLTGRGAR